MKWRLEGKGERLGIMEADNEIQSEAFWQVVGRDSELEGCLNVMRKDGELRACVMERRQVDGWGLLLVHEDGTLTEQTDPPNISVFSQHEFLSLKLNDLPWKKKKAYDYCVQIYNSLTCQNTFGILESSWEVSLAAVSTVLHDMKESRRTQSREIVEVYCSYCSTNYSYAEQLIHIYISTST